MLTRHDPDRVAPPFSSYSHGIEVPAGARWLYISGQVGVRPDGAMAEGAGAQIDQAWANLFAVLEAAGMAKADLVKVTSFLTREADIPVLRESRERLLPDHRPASTLLVISALAAPDILVEIEAVAAKVD